MPKKARFCYYTGIKKKSAPHSKNSLFYWFPIDDGDGEINFFNVIVESTRSFTVGIFKRGFHNFSKKYGQNISNILK